MSRQRTRKVPIVTNCRGIYHSNTFGKSTVGMAFDPSENLLLALPRTGPASGLGAPKGVYAPLHSAGPPRKHPCTPIQTARYQI
jgi:hypothetical protein